MKKTIFHLFFLFIVTGELIGSFWGIRILDYIFKPLIMIWIGGYFLLFSQNAGRKTITLAVGAFFFSWIGDLLLMFADRAFLFFLLGLVAFLIAQLCYLFLFRHTIRISGRPGFLKKQMYWLTAYLVYGVAFYAILFSHLDLVLQIAVFVYLTAILSMSAMALNRRGACSMASFRLVFAGSLFFIISDSLIALNKFLTPVPHERILIMTTYILAQYLIMRGILKQFEKRNYR